MKMPIGRVTFKPWMRIPGGISLALLLFYVVCINHTELTEIGIARNFISGEMWLQEGGGWHVAAPWVLVTCVDLRPMRVAMPSSGRAKSWKLIQFQQEGWRDFVALEGWRYYWWANRLSFNWGYDEESRGLRDILRGYAYRDEEYTFLVVLGTY